MTARRQLLGAAPLVLLFLLPLSLSLLLLLPGLVDVPACWAMVQHPQFSGALQLTVFTGIASTLLSLLMAVLIISTCKREIMQEASVFLSVPHLALALGLGLLIAPTGLLARTIAVLFTGWTSPPQWETTQDPYGLALVAALVLKETPFLVWAMASFLQQDEIRQRLANETSVARSLGHGARAVFFCIVLPQLVRPLLWPLIAVFSYGMTVVDMALVIGPTQPPTLAQVVWTDLNDGDVAANARGAAGTLLLSGVIILLLAAVVMLVRISRPLLRHWLTRGPSQEMALPFLPVWRVWKFVYAFVVLALVLQSISVLWPFPQMLATDWTSRAWWQVLHDVSPIVTSIMLAIVCSTLALLAVVTWLETQPQSRDRLVLGSAIVVLCLPALLLALGQYRLLLRVGGTGTWSGMLFAHVLPVVAYVIVLLNGPYRAYDPRWQASANGLGKSRFTFLRQIKWPMLKPALLSSLAVGFAVSMAQFVPAQLAAAGRFSTLPMEAVTLSSGGNRALIAAYALVLMGLPLLVFMASARASRPRWQVA